MNPDRDIATTHLVRPTPGAQSLKSSFTILPPRDISAESRIAEFQINTEIDRTKWKTRTEFCFTSLAFCLSLANLTRFPKAAWFYGQGTFVILYIITSVVFGSTLYFFEVALGQYSNRGSYNVFAMCPVFEGLSVSMAIYCAIISIIYNVVNVYHLIYALASFNTTLSYTICKNDVECDEDSKNQSRTPEHRYFCKSVARIKEEDEVGHINWRNFGVLFFVWMTISICILRGIRRQKWPPMVSVFFCYFVFLIVLLSSFTIDGSFNGLTFMFLPDWDTVGDVQVWVLAFEQTLLTLGLGMGPVITLASYCNFQSPAHLDSFLLCCLAITGSLLIGGILFSTIGILAAERNQTMHKVLPDHRRADSGFMIQIIFSQLFSRLPYGVGHVLNFLFFTTLIMCGWFSMILYSETTILTTCYHFHYFLSRRTKVKINLSVCIICFLLGSFFAHQPGDAILSLLEMHLVDIGLALIIMMELVAVIYIYGLHNFCDDIDFMLGFEPNIYYQIQWICLPGILLALYCYEAYRHIYTDKEETHQVVLLCTTVILLLPVFVKAVLNCYEFKKAGSLGRVFSPREVIEADDAFLSRSYFNRRDSRPSTST